MDHNVASVEKRLQNDTKQQQYLCASIQKIKMEDLNSLFPD